MFLSTVNETETVRFFTVAEPDTLTVEVLGTVTFSVGST